MNLTPEDLTRIQRVVNAIIRPLRYEMECPCQVWDSADTGVIIRRYKRGEGAHKDRRYMTAASFALDATERKIEDVIRRKAQLAVDAIQAGVMVRVKDVTPKVPKLREPA